MKNKTVWYFDVKKGDWVFWQSVPKEDVQKSKDTLRVFHPVVRISVSNTKPAKPSEAFMVGLT